MLKRFIQYLLSWILGFTKEAWPCSSVGLSHYSEGGMRLQAPFVRPPQLFNKICNILCNRLRFSMKQNMSVDLC